VPKNLGSAELESCRSGLTGATALWIEAGRNEREKLGILAKLACRRTEISGAGETSAGVSEDSDMTQYVGLE
jgi:hypothetical protein